MPFLTVIAGPNGSGKSTLIARMHERGIDFGHYINADDLAREKGLTGDEGALSAQRLADEERERCLHEGVDFSFETVMSHESKPQFMARARVAGYRVRLLFVATSDPQLNAERVRTRVKMGGHDVPADRIEARYRRSLALLPKAILASDTAMVFDNSRLALAPSENGLAPIIELFLIRNLITGDIRLPCPVWALEALRMPDEGYGLLRIDVVRSPKNIGRHMMNALWKADPTLCEKLDATASIKELLDVAQNGGVHGVYSREYN